MFKTRPITAANKSEQVEWTGCEQDLMEAIEFFEKRDSDDGQDLAELTHLADLLDKKGLHKIADKIDIVIIDMADNDAIESVLSSYRKIHQLGSRSVTAEIKKDDTLGNASGCPFGLVIPVACEFVGTGVNLMDSHAAQFEQNRRIYNKYRTHENCPFASKIMKDDKAVDCSFGTTSEGRAAPKMFRSSPIYPTLFQGFNTVNLDRSYFQFHDFNYYSTYG